MRKENITPSGMIRGQHLFLARNLFISHSMAARFAMHSALKLQPRDENDIRYWSVKIVSGSKNRFCPLIIVRDGPLEKWWGGGWGIFSLHEIFFSLTACAGIFFFRWTPLHEFFLLRVKKSQLDLPSAWIFFYLLLCMNFFSWHFPLHEFFFVFFPHHPPPPHHFSNGPSLREPSMQDAFSYLIFSSLVLTIIL